ncbi:hypothetical protein [Phocaeicola plebeius]|jgi:hypothetical protein|uniref:hypothetical protein n=1 Tax=Phocaeicola plebeius TaxID=310297 RepID=UPI003AB61EB6
MEQEIQLNAHNKQEYPPMHIDEYINEIKSCIQNNIPSILKNLIKHSQPKQKIIITAFQNQLLSAFIDSIPYITWTKEYKIGGRRDSIDIYGKENKGSYNIIIELDKPRADQIAKKIVSRIANFLDEPFIYIAICYPGTDKMNPNECIKYFEYGKEIINKINPNAKLVGCIISNNLNVEFY